MKLFKYIPLLLVVFLASCLDQQPISEIGEGNFYKTTAQINQAVIACYNGLQGSMKNEWMVTELRSDNARLQNTATTSADNTLLFNFDQAAISASNKRVYEYWLATYHNISRCNTVLKPQNLAVITDENLKKQYEGEALFIRAYHYFNLVRLFGPVFIVTERISAQEAKKYERKSVDEVYDQIITDLTDAIDKLPATYTSAEKGRITKWAAKSLLAKVYMTIQDYTNAELLLEDVYSNSGHSLLLNYADVFSTSNEMNNEIIFTVRYKSGGLGLGCPFGNNFAPKLSGSNVINGDGDGYNYPSTSLALAYTANDTRKAATIALNYINTSVTPNQTIDIRYVKKYLSPVTVKYDGDKDWPIIRFADIILLYAEVLNEKTGPSAALPYINETRVRAGLTDLMIEDVPNKHTMRMEIEKERRLEFAFENQRWFDLVRTNRAITVMNAYYTNEIDYYPLLGNPVGPLTDNTILLPIPQDELNINPNITQNPGY